MGAEPAVGVGFAAKGSASIRGKPGEPGPCSGGREPGRGCAAVDTAAPRSSSASRHRGALPARRWVAAVAVRAARAEAAAVARRPSRRNASPTGAADAESGVRARGGSRVPGGPAAAGSWCFARRRSNSAPAASWERAAGPAPPCRPLCAAAATRQQTTPARRGRTRMSVRLRPLTCATPPWRDSSRPPSPEGMATPMFCRFWVHPAASPAGGPNMTPDLPAPHERFSSTSHSVVPPAECEGRGRRRLASQP